jgi:hypothetical protein
MDVKDWIKSLGARRRYVLAISNNVRWAGPLHHREGFFVLDTDHTRQSLDEVWAEAAPGSGPVTGDLIGNVLEATGRKEVNFLRSYTNENRPPAKLGEGFRKAHPGHWSDVSGRLNNGYRITWHTSQGTQTTGFGGSGG